MTADPPPTGPRVYLVRHGSAGTRDDFDPADAERHLDEHGRSQAALLAERLTGVDRVLSSPASRCVETVAPLAAVAGTSVEVDHRLFEGTDVEAAWSVVDSAVESGRVTVLCSHGDVIPDLVRRAQQRGMEVPGKSGCSKGSVWALDWDGERFTTGSYQRTDA